MGLSVLMEGDRGEHKHHNQQKNDKEEDKGWFAILLLQLVQPYAATCDEVLPRCDAFLVDSHRSQDIFLIFESG